MRRLVLLAALLPALAFAQEDGILPPGGVSGAGILGQGGQAEYLLPGGNVGIATSPLFCTAARNLSLLSGSYACLNGDGTQDSSAGMTLSAVGSPTTQTLATSPNGNNSTAVSRQRLNGATQYFQTPSIAPPAGDFTACGLAVLDAPLTTGETLIAQDDGTTRAWRLQVTSANLNACTNGGSTCVVASPNNVVVGGGESLVCVTFARGASSGTTTLYVDGATVGTPASLPNPSSASQRIFIGSAGGNQPVVGAMRGAFFTSKALTATDVSRLTAALIPTPQTASGQAISNSRNSASWVTTSDGILVALPPGRTGVVGVPGDTMSAIGGIPSAPSRTNLLTYSEQFDNAVWGKNGAGFTVTANGATAPDGSQTADTVSWTSAVSYYNINQGGATANGGAYTVTGYQKSSSGTYPGSVEIYDTTGAASLCIGTATVGTTWTRISCTVASTTNGHVLSFRPWRYNAGSGAAGSAYAWGGMGEQSSIASPYCRSEGTSATCSGDVVTVPTPGWLSTKEGCAKVCVTPTWTGNNPAAGSLFFLDGNSAGTARLVYVTSGLNSVGPNDGSHGPIVGANFTAGTRACYVTRWSASGNYLRADNIAAGVQGTPTAFSGFPSFDSTLAIGNHSGSNQPLGSIIDSVTLGSSPGGCQ